MRSGHSFPASSLRAPVGHLAAILAMTLLWHSFFSGALHRTHSLSPFRPKDGKFPLYLAESTSLSLVVSLYSAHTLETDPLSHFLNCPSKAHIVFLGTISCVHAFPVLTSNRGSKHYFRGIRSIISKLVPLMCFFYTFVFLLLPSHLTHMGGLWPCSDFSTQGSGRTGLEDSGVWVKGCWMNLG